MSKRRLYRIIDRCFEVVIGDIYSHTLIPFDHNIEAWVNLYRTHPDVMNLITDSDLCDLAQYIFPGYYIIPISTWSEDYSLDEFNARLNKMIKSVGLPYHLTYSLSAHTGRLFKYRYNVSVVDTTYIKDHLLNGALDI